LSTTANT